MKCFCLLQQLKDELAEVVAEMENMDTADDRWASIRSSSIFLF